jgi:hypothetical protein
MGYKVLNAMDSMRDKYGPRAGLEGPYSFLNGRVLYYDPREGQYYDPATDFYVEDDEMQMLRSAFYKLFEDA